MIAQWVGAYLWVALGFALAGSANLRVTVAQVLDRKGLSFGAVLGVALGALVVFVGCALGWPLLLVAKHISAHVDRGQDAP